MAAEAQAEHGGSDGSTAAAEPSLSVRRSGIVSEHSRGERDTGSPEVQAALLSDSIQRLQAHLNQHRKDHSSRRGLIRMVNRRRKLLDYLKRQDLQRYSQLIAHLGLRR